VLNEFKDAFRKPNNAHVQLIIVNIVVFVVLGVLMVVSDVSGFPNFFSAVHSQFQIPARFSEFITQPWTLISYAFAHDLTRIWHILFNMLTLYWFGRLFVEYLGSDKLIATYVLGGMAGATVYLLSYNLIPYYIERTINTHVIMVGGSASVDAIVVACATLLPDYTFFLLFFGPVRIKYIAAVIVFLSFLGSVGTNAGGNIAHLGGALMGFIYTKQLQAGINWGSWITSLLDAVKSVFASKPRVKVTYRKEETRSPKKDAPKFTRATQDEIDVILDKISERGYESLSKEEKEKLFNASKK
jgi:membrane associated rhomboid family serine protease